MSDRIPSSFTLAVCPIDAFDTTIELAMFDLEGKTLRTEGKWIQNPDVVGLKNKR